MAGRKKTEVKKSKFDISIGFVRRWDYFTDSYVDQMNGHPLVGRVYRLIKDDMGYRLHIGRENNDIGLDGLFLGPKLVAERPDFAFEVEIVTPENYLKLPLTNDDASKVVEWITTENKDLWETLKKEEDGTATTAVGKLSDLIALMNQGKEPFKEPTPTTGQKERAAQAAMEIIIQFKKKSTTELLQLFDGMYERLVTIQNS